MLTIAQVDDRLKRLSGRYGKINEDVQDMAVAIVSHANDTGDCDRARRLCRAVPPRLRNLLIFWFRNVSPINVTIGRTAVDDKVSLRKEGKKLYNPFDVDKAAANKWFENPFELPQDTSLETTKTYYDSFDRLFDRMARNTKDDAGKIEPDDISSVQALRAFMREQFIRFKEENPIEEQEMNDDETTADAAEAMARAAG